MVQCHLARIKFVIQGHIYMKNLWGYVPLLTSAQISRNVHSEVKMEKLVQLKNEYLLPNRSLLLVDDMIQWHIHKITRIGATKKMSNFKVRIF